MDARVSRASMVARMRTAHMSFKRKGGIDRYKWENTNPTRADVLYEMNHWHVHIKTMPGWRRHFAVCMKRGTKKLIRKRRSLYAKYLAVSLASAICGMVCYTLKDDRNMFAILCARLP